MNKIALVTGSSRGIGAATARKLALEGYSVCINYIKDTDSAQKVVDQIEEMGGSAISVQADVSEEEEVEKLFTTIDDKLGRINVLINNAGILFTQMNIDTMTAERINRTLKTNVTGYFLCCREAVKSMSYRYGGSGGVIVNVSSAASRIGSAGEYIDYAASKGAVDTLTIGLSLETAVEAGNF